MDYEKIENLKDIFIKISLGESTLEERSLVERLDNDLFFSYLEEFGIGVNYTSVINFDHEWEIEMEKGLDTSYSEVIPESSNISDVKIFARKKGLLKRFLKRKQRIRNQDLI